MVLIDANILLRYVLNDHPKLSPKTKDAILDNDILILTQVIAEVIYVLKGVYQFAREEIADTYIFCRQTMAVYPLNTSFPPH